MLTLSSKERSFLKKKAHYLEPLVRIGKDGVDDNVIKSIYQAVKKRELIKVKFLQNSDLEIDRDLCNDIARESKSVFVDKIGKILIFFKPNMKDGKLTKEFYEFRKIRKKGKK